MAFIGIVGAVQMLSCSGEEELPRSDEQHAISFASVSEEQEMVTRAASALANDFVVYGYKNVAGSTQTVFDGYTVTYQAGSSGTSEDNTHGYCYVNGGQTIRYWDFGATEYNFWGATGGQFNSDGTELTISDLSLTTTEPTSLPLYTQLYHRQPVTTDVVQLQFKHPYAKVRVMFYTSEELTGTNEIQLTGITFGGGAGSIATAGKIAVNYGKTGIENETITMTATGHKDNLTFGNITLSKDHGTASNNSVLAPPTGGTEWYYALPLSTADSAQPFTMQISIDGESKTAVVPDAYMHWSANTSYTYYFKITGAGKKMEFDDVLIDSWKSGGSQDDEWKNW